MTAICHSLRLPLRAGADIISPSGDAVMSSVIDAAEELQRILTVITALQGEKKGAPMQEPSFGIDPTSSG